MEKGKNNKVGNYFYDISHRIYVSGNGDINESFGVEVIISKVEIISETPKKFNIRFKTMNHLFNKVNETLKVKEKLYKKDDVDISDNTETIEDLIKKFNNYKASIQKSDRIAEYKKRAILEAMDRFSDEKITKIFQEDLKTSTKLDLGI